MAEGWRVRLRDAERPFRVFVNGVQQTEGSDYTVRGRDLVFSRPLEKERLGFWRWTAIFLPCSAPTGRTTPWTWRTRWRQAKVASGLEIVPPS